jgi:hypothetical protein
MECDKRSYDSPKDAHDDLVGLRQRGRGHKFSMYKCTQCGYYHITTVTKRSIRPRKKDKYPIEIPPTVERKQKTKSKNKKK